MTPLRSIAAGGRAALAGLLVAAAVLFLSLSKAEAMKIQVVKSPGGVTAWLVEEHSVPLIAMRFAFEGGNAQDPAGKEGLAHFLAGMLDEGAGDLTSKQFQERVEEIAMRMSFEDARDAFYGSFETLTENRDKAAALLALAIGKPRFDTDAVDRVRGQLLAGIAHASRDPNRVASDQWQAMAFPGHPYGRPANGTPASVQGMTRDDLAKFWSRTFARSNLSVVVVGDIDAPTLAKMLDTVFGQLPAKARPDSGRQCSPRLGREAARRRDGGAAVGGAFRAPRHAAQGQGLPARLRAQHHPRRRRHVVAGCGRRCARSAASPTRSTPA